MNENTEWRRRSPGELICEGDKLWNSTTLPFNPDIADNTRYKTEQRLEIEGWWNTQYYTRINPIQIKEVPIDMKKVELLSSQIKKLSAELANELAKNTNYSSEERRLDPDL